MKAQQLLILAAIVIEAPSQIPLVSSGQVTRFENFQSKFVEPRNVDVWIPSNYSAVRSYSVLYMHDGQMLFDSASTWNKQAWDVDDIVGRLLKEKKIRNVIVVAIWNTATRHSEYFPQKPFESLTLAERDTLLKTGRAGGLFPGEKINSDNYLRFLVQELKPFIDTSYSTHRDPAQTFVAGSSMGGLISMYAICEYPNVFGGAACISTHWPGTFTVEKNPIPGAFISYLKSHLPDPKTHKIYFDYGTATLDALYAPLQNQVDEVMKVKGWKTKNWITREFPGEDHSEKAWRKRLDVPVTFLLAK